MKPHGASGQVLTDFKGVSVFDLNRQREQEIRIVREKAVGLQSPDTFSATAASRLGLDRFMPRRVPIRIEKGSSASSLVFEFGPGISVPALEVPRKAGANIGPTHVLVGPGWREKLDSGTLGEITGTAGSIIVIDPRGMGWTAAPPGEKSPESPFGRDWTDAFLALSVNRPLLGQRVARLLDTLETLHEQPGGERAAGFHIVGSGPAGLVALHAALLDGRGLIKKVTLHRSLISWSDIVQG